MRQRLAALLAAGTVCLALAGCDSFSVLGQFQRGSPLNLALQEDTLLQGAATDLYPSGGEPPYSFGVVAGNLYYTGTLGSVSGETYTAGTAIGTVIIHLTDAAGTGADAVVTVIPPTPASFAVQPNPGLPANDILVTWSYSNTALISGFTIQRSLDDVTFATVASQPSSATSYVDPALAPGTTYYYRMYAIAGTYQSFPTGVMGSTP